MTAQDTAWILHAHWVRGLCRPAAAAADPFCSYQDHAKLDLGSVATDASFARSASLLPPSLSPSLALCHLMGANNWQPTDRRPLPMSISPRN